MIHHHQKYSQMFSVGRSVVCFVFVLLCSITDGWHSQLKCVCNAYLDSSSSASAKMVIHFFLLLSLYDRSDGDDNQSRSIIMMMIMGKKITRLITGLHYYTTTITIHHIRTMVVGPLTVNQILKILIFFSRF